MTRVLAGLSIIAFVLAACGGGAGAPTGGAGTAGGASATPAAATSAAATGDAGTPAATAPASEGGAQPPAGGQTVAVTLTGGKHAGSYTGTGDPLCTNGLVGPNSWGVQYSIQTATAEQFSSLQMVVKPKGSESEGMFEGTGFLMTVTIGPILEGTNYEVQVHEEPDRSKGQGSATIDDKGATAVIKATGTTADGVKIDATVNCPSVQRTGG